MARATAAQMLILSNGVYPPGHDGTSFGAIATHCDALIDAYCLRWSPATLSTTDATALGVANRIAVAMVNHSLYVAGMGGEAHPHLFTEHPESLTKLIDNMMRNQVSQTGAVDLIDTSE